MKIQVSGKLPRRDDIDGVPDEFLNPHSNPEHISSILPRTPIVKAAQQRGELEEDALYLQYIDKCFDEARNFAKEHRRPRSDEDWLKLVEALHVHKEPLTHGLVIAAVEYFERDYKSSQV